MTRDPVSWGKVRLTLENAKSNCQHTTRATTRLPAHRRTPRPARRRLPDRSGCRPSRPPNRHGRIQPRDAAPGRDPVRRTNSRTPRALWICGQLLAVPYIPAGSTTTGEFKIFDPAFGNRPTGNSNCRRRKRQLTLTTGPDDDLERPVRSFCGARSPTTVPQGWFSAELEHVVDEERAAVEVRKAVACPDREGQVTMTARHLAAQGWVLTTDPF